MNNKYKTDICKLSWGMCEKYGLLIHDKLKKSKKFKIVNISLFIFFGIVNIFLIIMIVVGLKSI